MVIFTWPPVTYLLAKSLEYRYPPVLTVAPPDADDTIIVLTGGVDSADALRPYPELKASSLYRCLRTAELYKSGVGCDVLISGGKVNPSSPGATSSHVMRDFLEQLGVKAADLRVEDRSRTTHESAVLCKRLLKSRPPARVFLVTDAMHLRRATACFEAQGIKVIPAGCHYRSTRFDWKLATFLPKASALPELHNVMHEWAGLAWYWLHGRL